MTTKAPLLYTDRLVLAPVRTGDVPALVEHWNAPPVRRHLWDDEPVGSDTVTTLVDASADSFIVDGFGLWSLRLRHDAGRGRHGEPLIGACGLRRERGGPADGPVTEFVELVVSLDPGLQRRGLATEAALAVLRHAFTACRLHTVLAGADESNTASLRLLQRLGMHPIDPVRVGDGVYPYFVISRDEFLRGEGAGSCGS